MPEVTTIANRRRHGAMIRTSVRQRRQRADLRGLGVGRGRRLLAVIGRLRRAADRGEFLDREVEIVAALLGLRPHQPAIRTVAADQLGMAAALDDAAVIEHEDAVGADHARQPVRQDQGRAPLRQPVERLLDHRLVLGIDRGQRLVEDQDRRVAQQCPRDRQTLALSAGQIDAALADDRVIALRQLRDEFVRVGVARRLPRSRPASRPACRAADSPRPCRGTGRCPDARPRSVRRSASGSSVRRSWPPTRTAPDCGSNRRNKQPRDRRFARAARADDADLLAGRDRERQPVMRRPAARRDRRNAHRRIRWWARGQRLLSPGGEGRGEGAGTLRAGASACSPGHPLPHAGEGCVRCTGTSGSAASSAWMPAAADWPTIP